ncbi:hypothetical protein OE766_23630 [Pararhizobium sp. YC-54]|uniref:hypothetical protein n=1 Tax=Pararhizobium sp. YC-54 TaxID=2986920 RepID=UPI0021F7C255|nr:hypothetical protein [Pararhizobium sp. YC-54]MCW0001216.1 hypothetical protein [Pararhizobium sp. YC-54]
MMAEPTNRDLESLRAEVARLSKIVSAQSAHAYSDVRDRASGVIGAAAPVARKAASLARSEGSAIAQSAREHPAAAGSALTLALLIGGVLGFLLGAASRQEPEPPRRRYW